jgi:hypothetical protein
VVKYNLSKISWCLTGKPNGAVRREKKGGCVSTRHVNEAKANLEKGIPSAEDAYKRGSTRKCYFHSTKFPTAP